MRKIKKSLVEYKSVFIISLTAAFVILGTLFISLFIRGYRPDLKNKILVPTGLLSVTSLPRSASVHINDRLTTATDDTINLPPGDYKIKIEKDGYLPWEKNITLKKEVVYQTNTHLFRSVPDLNPLTLSGAINPTLSPDGSRIVYSVASASASVDNGLYVLELSNSPLNIVRSSPKQISQNYKNITWASAYFTFSPDSQKILAYFKKDPSLSPSVFSPEWIENVSTAYLFGSQDTLSSKDLLDITLRLPILKEEWQETYQNLLIAKMDKLPKLFQSIASDSAAFIIWSSEEDKIAYLAKKDAIIPENIITPPPAQSTQIQERTIKAGHIYVYDLKDDTNFHIADQKDLAPNPNYSEINHQPVFLSWLPYSHHLTFIQDKKIKVIEYDSTNQLDLYGGQFDPQAVFPYPDGNKLIILTHPYDSAPENLYAIGIKWTFVGIVCTEKFELYSWNYNFYPPVVGSPRTLCLSACGGGGQHGVKCGARLKIIFCAGDFTEK